MYVHTHSTHIQSNPIWIRPSLFRKPLADPLSHFFILRSCSELAEFRLHSTLLPVQNTLRNLLRQCVHDALRLTRGQERKRTGVHDP